MSVVKITGYEAAPAVFDPEWLPHVDVWAELSKAQAEVSRLREVKDGAGRAYADAKARLEALEEERQQSMRDSFREGHDGTPDVSIDKQIEQARDEVAALDERGQAAVAVWLEAINAAIALVAERRTDWLRDLADHDSRVEVRISDLRRELSDAEAQRGQTARLRHWVDRTGGEAAQMPGMHIQFTGVPTAAPQAVGIGEDSSAHDEWKRDHMAANYAGPKATRITDEEKAAIEAREFDLEVDELRAEYESGKRRQEFEALGGTVS